MKLNKMSDYDRYIIFADMSGKYIVDYESFLNFCKIKEVLGKIGSSQSSNYLYDNDIYVKPITSSDARTILNNFNFSPMQSKDYIYENTNYNNQYTYANNQSIDLDYRLLPEH